MEASSEPPARELPPRDALESLCQRLRYLRDLTRAEGWQRADALIKYRQDALAAPIKRRDILTDPELTGRLFSYIHNEFLFNSARKLGPIVQQTHVVFAPLYTDQLSKEKLKALGARQGIVKNGECRANPQWELKLLHKGTSQTLEWMRQRAVHESRDRRDFRGGKDRIYRNLGTLYDFSEPIGTPKRYIIDLRGAVLDNPNACKMAREESDKNDADIAKLGVSNIASNTVEFFWRASAMQKHHFRWARHDRPYQTFTFTCECTQTADKEDGSSSRVDTEEWTRDIFQTLNADAKDGRSDPFRLIAPKNLDADVFEKVMGRYVHGANFLILPIKLFLGQKVQPSYALGEATLAESLVQLAPDDVSKQVSGFVEGWKSWAGNPEYEGLLDNELAAFLRLLREHPDSRRRLDALVIGASRDFLLPHCFPVSPSDRFDSELVGYKCMGGRAYVFSDVRNNRTDTERSQDSLFSRSVIIDCGLNEYERGRLMQNLTEFATERIMALVWLPQFRMVHHTLNVVQHHLGLAVANYYSDEIQSGEVIPATEDLPLSNRSGRSGEKGLLSALEFLSACLTVLNDVVEGGIVDRAHSAEHTLTAVRNKLHAIDEERLPGYQTLSDFLQRRFTRPARTIVRAGERYEMLRRRISEVSGFIDVRIQSLENQTHQLGIARGIIIALVGAAIGMAALVDPLTHFISKVRADKMTIDDWSAIGLALGVLAILSGVGFYWYRHRLD